MLSFQSLRCYPPFNDQVAVKLTGNGVSAIQNIQTQSMPAYRFTNDIDNSSGNASISDDGSRIAFASRSDLITGSNPSFQTQIFVINRDGTGLMQLTADSLNGSFHASLSGDGSRIAFHSSADLTGGNLSNKTQVFFINSDGTGLTQLTADDTGFSTRASISGDGSRIAFESNADLVSGENPSFQKQIFVINSDSTGLLQLTDGTLNNILNPSISADGSRIAFQSNSDLISGKNPSFQTQIFVIDSDGSGGLTQLTSDETNGSRDPSLSGDGSRVAFESNADLTGIGNPDNVRRVFVINTDGSGVTQIADGWDPSLSKDGSRVAFETPDDFVGIMNSDGTGPLTEFRQILDADDLSLSADGAFLAFEGNGEDSTDQVYLYEVAKADSDNDGVLDTSEGTAANNAALAMGLNLSIGSTVDISVPATLRLSGVIAEPATGGPAGVAFPFGTIFYKTTSGIGESVTTTFNFSLSLPENLMLYKVDANGTYTVIPATQWTKTGATSLDLTLTDGGTFDLDGVENGVIVDPLALGFFNAPPSAPTLLSPENGATGLGTTVDFEWKASTDANGDTITYDFFICENNTFDGSDCGPTTVSAVAKKGLTAFASYGSGLFIFGIVLMGGLKKKNPAFMIALIVTSGLVLGACNSGGGGGGPATLSHQESALKAGTTYHWKVLASDGKSRTESSVRTFTTQ